MFPLFPLNIVSWFTIRRWGVASSQSSRFEHPDCSNTTRVAEATPARHVIPRTQSRFKGRRGPQQSQPKRPVYAPQPKKKRASYRPAFNLHVGRLGRPCGEIRWVPPRERGISPYLFRPVQTQSPRRLNCISCACIMASLHGRACASRQDDGIVSRIEIRHGVNCPAE